MYGSTDARTEVLELPADKTFAWSEALLDACGEESTVDRRALITELESRALRARYCRSVPASVILYIIFITSLLTRMPVDKTFEFERGWVKLMV